MSRKTKIWRYKFKLPPAPYQLECLKRALRRGRFGIFFQQRVGKTKVAIDFCGIRHISKGYTKVLIVCPLSVRTEWEVQIHEHLSDDVKKFSTHLYPNSSTYKYKEKRKELLKYTKKVNDLTFIIVNYDALSVDETERFVRWQPDIIVFDECHLLKNHASRRSKAAFRLSKNTKDVLGLTGTPIPKTLKDIFGVFRAIDSTVYGHRWVDFKRRYCVMGGFEGKEIVDYNHKDELAEKMKYASMRVLRKDVMEEPNEDEILIPVDLEPQARKQYNTLKKLYITFLNESTTVTADMAGVRIMRLQQLCGGFLPDDETGKLHQVSHAKLKVLKDLLNTHVKEGGEKVIIVSRFKEEIRAIADMVKGMGIEPLIFSGQESEEEKLRARMLFQENSDYPVIIMQIQTGGMGIPLHAAHIMIYYSMDFSLVNFQQSRDRPMGRGQKHHTVTRYFLAVKDSVDEKIIKTLRKDEDLTSSVADKWRWFLD